MSSKSIGTLTIDLIAKVGGFVSGMDKAERSSEKWRKNVESNVKAAGAAVAGVVAIAASASVAAASAGIALLKSTSEQITETDRWAKSLNMSTQELLAWQYAAEQAGLTGDNIADIFKDINDKVGDAVLNQSGEAAQALDTLGLSAKKLAEQSPDKQLLAISSALEKIPTQAGKTNILESLGNDLSKLLPLFDNNNERLKSFIQLSKDFGVAPPQEDIDNLVKVNQFFQDLETQAKGLKIEIASGLAKVDLSPLQAGLDDMKKVFTDPAVLEGLTQLVGQMAQLVGWMGKMGSETGSFLTRLSEIPDRINAGGWYQYEQNKKLEGMADLLAGDLKFAASPSKKSAVIVDNNLGAGESNQKTKPDAGLKKLESAYKEIELSYKRQISLIDTTGKKTAEVTELQKLQFDIADGKLAGLNEAQKNKLELLAKELDSLNSLKKANEENLKVADYVASLNSSNMNSKSSLNISIGGAWLGNDDRDRLKERLSIEEDFLIQQRDLQSKYQSKEIDKSFYDRGTQALKDALSERLDIQNEHYKKVDELQNSGTAGFVSGMATQMQASMDLYSNMQQVGSQAFSSLTDMIIQWAETGKLNVKDFAATFIQSVGAALLQYAAAQVAMAALQAFTSMIGIPYVGPEIAPAAAIAAAATAGVLMVGVSSALSGQAHDGIDSVPETGTWLLQKGERVTTAKTSAKLDATLERVNQQSASGGDTYAPVINLNVNGDPSDAQIAMMNKAADDGAYRGYMRAVESIATRTGLLHKAMQSTTNAGVKKT